MMQFKVRVIFFNVMRCSFLLLGLQKHDLTQKHFDSKLPAWVLYILQFERYHLRILQQKVQGRNIALFRL